MPPGDVVVTQIKTRSKSGAFLPCEKVVTRCDSNTHACLLLLKIKQSAARHLMVLHEAYRTQA